MYKILLIEDDSTLRDTLAAILKFEGYQLIEAGNGSIGLHLAQQEFPDLIVCDVELPDQNGLNILASLRQGAATINIPVIMLTGNVYEDTRLAAIELGVDAYLFKPCPIQRLLTAITQALSKCQKRSQLFI